MPNSNSNLVSYNPATGESIGEVRVTTFEEITEIVARSKDAQRNWGRLSFRERRECLEPFGEKLVAQKDSLGRLLTDEMGKPLPEGIGEVERAGVSYTEYLDEIMSALQPTPLEDEYTKSEIHYIPFGVCLTISPWNFPLYMPHWMLIPALMAGNSCILKPSEETPLIAQAYVDLLAESLPENVLQIAHGNEKQGQALVSSDVDLICFTGSRSAGTHILGEASKRLKRVILELGGKDPLIVLEDADIEEAAKFAANNSFRNAGQVCVSTERIYVDEKILEPFQQEMLKITESLKVGPGTEEGVNIGPIIHEGQRKLILEQVEEALKDGAKMITSEREHPEHFITPMILSNMNHNMRIMREETFGPIACIQSFTNIEEAIELANDSPYGLGASVFGADEAQARNVATRLEIGMVGINRGCYGAGGSPWVGAKQSGYGFHSGKEGHRQFAQTKVVSIGK